MIAAVLDCVICVQAALSRRGPAFACLQLAEAEYVTLYMSPDILDEIRRALSSLSLRRSTGGSRTKRCLNSLSI
jgi:predicted nucleic acid-binding protein